MFYRLFSGQGVELRPVPESLRRDLRYDRHEHGDRITIHYASDEAWSKTYRDKPAWAKKSILNVARMGKFSSDRTIQQYADEIWGVKPVKPA